MVDFYLNQIFANFSSCHYQQNMFVTIWAYLFCLGYYITERVFREWLLRLFVSVINDLYFTVHLTYLYVKFFSEYRLNISSVDIRQIS